MAASEFPFFSLPGELRNQIYRYLITSVSQPPDTHSETVSESEVEVQTAGCATNPPLSKSLPRSVVLVNKQFAEEAKHAFFRSMNFTIASRVQEIFRDCANFTELPAAYGRIFSKIMKLNILVWYWHPLREMYGEEPWAWEKYFQRVKEVVRACKHMRRLDLVFAGKPEDRSMLRAAFIDLVVWCTDRNMNKVLEQEVVGPGGKAWIYMVRLQRQ